MRRRVRRLTPDVRRVGRLVAASSDPRERLIRAACDDGESWAAIDQAIDDGIIERDGDALRFTHPLLRSVLYGEMPLNERRQVHQRLGAAAEDIEERAWHLALGADRPSEEIAGMLDGAARHAASRGAPEEAATLAEQAARLTPAGRPEAARERTVHAADYHFRAGDIARSRELIESALPACPAGPLRASLLLRLATIHYHQSGWPLAEQTFRQAAEEAPDDPALCAHAEQELAFARLVAGDLPGASRWAKASLRSAEQAADPRLMAHSLARHRHLRVPPGPRRAAGPAGQGRGARRRRGRGAGRAPADVRPVPGQRTGPQMVRPAGRGAAEAGRPVPARARPRRRGIAAVPAVPLQRARVLGRELGCRRGIRAGGLPGGRGEPPAAP